MHDKVKNELITQVPTRLSNLPKEQKGIYLLFSHNAQPLYLGITASSGFYNRIFSRHVTGTGRDGNSHKFGWGYNVGPFYLERFNEKKPFIVQEITVSESDIKLVRMARAKFLREHCSASYVAIPRPNGCLDNTEFKHILENNYEIPIKRKLQLPWQDNKGASVINYDPELKILAWKFIDQLGLDEAQLKVLRTMENLFELTVLDNQSVDDHQTVATDI
ncbi:MAG: hypothetical protein MI976_30435 [Pseudomonadales bacterium]|nr:hypothetical protein [Pseudomonadales bacterium]